MITITLQKSRDASPCPDGWKKVLESKGGSAADIGAEFPLSDVLESNDLNDTLWCLRCLPEHDRLWRKYAVWCARQVQHLMTDQRSIDALDVAWRHSDGLATDAELDAAWAAARDAARHAAAVAARAAAWAAAAVAARDAAMDAAWAAAAAAGWVAARAAKWDAARAAGWDAAMDAARAAQKTKLLQILTAGGWVE